MSTMVGTSRAGRPSKDKNVKSAPAPTMQTPTVNKTDKAAPKNQATVEQMRMAQIIDSGKDAANLATVRELMEMTGRTQDDVIVALHDAQDDPDRAVMILLEEGGAPKGEWVEQGKKKKRSNTGKPDKDASISIPDIDAGDSRPERSRDRRDHDRHDVPPRRGRDRRNGGPPPRLARGRGRDRNHFGGSGGGVGNRDRDRSNFNGEPEREEDWDTEPISDSRDRRPDRGQFGERGRGRGRGGFGRPSARGGRPRRFDRQTESSDGPHIDTWTNETAENAEKENSSWGDQWEATEDWSEDTYTGTLDESKVFTPSQTNSMMETDMAPALNDTTNTIGQRTDCPFRLDVGSLFSKSAEFAKAPDYTKTTESSGDSFFSQYNQQATESIKNSIGIGSSNRQTMSSIPVSQTLQQSQPLGGLGSMGQRDMGQNVGRSMTTSVTHPMMPPTTSAALQQAPSQQQVQRRPQRSKLPPPSKIPQSAVEMPGHMMPQLDVQFGVDFGSDSTTSQFGFGSSGGGGGDSNTVQTFSSSTSASSSVLTNHMGQSNKAESAARQSSVMSSPSAGSKPQPSTTLPPMDASPSRQTVFPNSVYTTPTKSETQSKVASEPIPFSSPSDHKSSGLVSSQRTAQSPATLSQGSMSTSKPDTSNLPSFSASNGYSSSSYSAHTGHKSAGGHSSSASPANQTFSHSAATSQPVVSSFQNQYTSQNQFAGGQVSHGSQSQFPSAGQTQYPGSQSQYHSTSSAGSSGPGQSQYMSNQAQYQSGQGSFPPAPVSQSQYQSSGQYGGYQSNTSTFQNQGGMSSAVSSQSAQNSLYPASTQQSGGSYPSVSSSYHVRESQSGSGLQGSGASQSNTYQAQPAPSLKASTSQSSSNYSSQTYSGSHATQHTQNLQSSPLTNKLGDSLSKMSLKEGSQDTRSSSQFEHGNASTTSASLTTTAAPSSISTVTSTVSATTTPVATSSTLNSRVSTTTGSSSGSLPITTKAPPNLPPGVPLLNPHQYIMGQAGTLPPFYGLQQPVYGYEDLQLLQQRLPLASGSYYDISAFPGVPSTMATGRDQAAALGTAPFTGAGGDKTLNRVEAQSPSASSQAQSTHTAPQQTLPFNIHYGYYYPGLPGTPGFQYPTMFPMPPVTNAPAPHVPGTTTTTQLPKTYGSHQGYATKGAGTTADMNTAAFTKSHTQGFDKQGFPGGTPPPFNLPLASASQAGPLGAPTAPYGAPYLPMMPPQAHNQTILHHPLQQDSGAGSARGIQQPANQAKSGGGKPYGNYWGN